MAKVDKYRSWEELLQNTIEKEDYRIRIQIVDKSKTAILAPHGGGIEFLTLPLARSIAGDNYNFYAFEGIRAKNNRDLHITSHRFREARGLALIANCNRVVAVHGLEGKANSIQVGGADSSLRQDIHEALFSAGFNSDIITTGEYAGTDPLNICNRGRKSMGVQIELSAGLRNVLKEDKSAYIKFVAAVRFALEKSED